MADDYPVRAGRGSFLAAKDDPPVHAARWRFDADHSSGVETRCGRTLYAPLEFAPETNVTCLQCEVRRGT